MGNHINFYLEEKTETKIFFPRRRVIILIFSMNYLNGLPLNTMTLFMVVFVILTIVLVIMLTIFRKKLKGKKIRIMVGWGSTMLLVFIILFMTGTFGRFVNVEKVDSKEYKKSELVEDLRQVENCIFRENPFIFTDEEEVKSAFADTYGQIEEGMTELEFYRLINPLVVKVNCGHTNLSISRALQKNREETAVYFPLKVTLVDNEFYFLEGSNSSGIMAGDQLKSINGKSSSQILQILLDNISGDGDNEAKKRYIISKHFNNKFFDFVDNSSSFDLEYVDSDGNLKKTRLEAEYRREFNTSAWELHFNEYQDGNHYEGKVFDDYAVLTVRVFMSEKDEKFSLFLEDFFLSLKENHISKLLIDLRGNFGGSPDLSKNLLSYLVSKETVYLTGELPFLQNLLGFKRPIIPAENRFSGELLVLTDGAVFSTAGHFCAIVKYHKLGTLLGSRTAGTFVCTDSSKDTVLANTRLCLHYSTLAYQVAVEGFSINEGIEPDVKVELGMDSILNNRDIQMERALQYLREESLNKVM